MAGNTGNLTIGLNLSTGNFTQQMKSVQNAVKMAEAEFAKASASMDKNVQSVEKLKLSQKKLVSQVETLSKGISAQKTHSDELKKSLENQSTAVENSKKKYADLAKELENAKNQFGDGSKEVKKLEKQLNAAEKEVKRNENAFARTTLEIEKNQISLKQNEAQLENYKNELKNVNTQIERFKWTKLSQDMDKFGTSMKTVGKGIEEVGKKVSVLSASIAGLAGVSINFLKNYEYAMSEVQAISRVSQDEFEQLSDKAREMGKATSFSAADAANGLKYMAVAGWDTHKMLNGLEPILRLAEAGAMDLGRASDLVTDTMGGLNMKIEELDGYLDVIALGANKSNTSVEQLLSAFLNVGSSASRLRIPVQELSAALGILANNGTKGELAGTKLNSILTRITAQTKPAQEAWQKLGVNVYDTQGKFRGLTTVLLEANNSLKKFSEEEQSSILKKAVGTDNIVDFQNLLKATSGDLQTLTSELYNSDGALMAMATTMKDNLKGRIEIMESAFEEAAITLGESLLPVAEKVVAKITEWCDAFAELDEDTRTTIIAIGGFVAIGGPALLMIGKLVSGIGSLAKLGSKTIKAFSGFSSVLKGGAAAAGENAGAITKLTSKLLGLSPATLAVGAALAAAAGGMYLMKKNADINNATIKDTTDEMSALERGLNKLNGGYSKSRKELEDLGIVKKKFSETLSEDFTKAVERADEQLRKLHLAIEETGFNADNILSQEESENIVSRISDMSNGVINTIKSKTAEVQENYKKFFMDDGTIDAQEQLIIEHLNKQSQISIDEVDKLQKEIKEILQRAVDEKRELNNQEIANIQEKNIRIKQIELEALGGTEEEIIFAKKEFAARVRKMDIEEAQALLQEKAKLRDEEKIKIEASYDTYIESLKKHLQSANGETRIAYQKELEEAELQKAEKLKIQDNLYNEYLTLLRENNSIVAAEINVFNNELLTTKDKKNQEELKKMLDHYSAANEITEDGMYKLYNSQTKIWRDVVVEVDEATGKIIGMYEMHSYNVGAYSKEIADSIKEKSALYRTLTDEDINNINRLNGATLNHKNELIDANGEIIGSLEDVQKSFDNTKTGILDINGIPMKIKVNRDEVVGNIDDINKRIGSVPTKKKVTFDIIGNISKTVSNLFGKGGSSSRSIPAPEKVTKQFSPFSMFRSSFAVMPENFPTLFEDKDISTGYNDLGSDQIKASVKSFNMPKETPKNDNRVENLLEQLVTLMSNQKQVIEVPVIVNGQTIAKASAPYMEPEIDRIKNRKKRIGG